MAGRTYSKKDVPADLLRAMRLNAHINTKVAELKYWRALTKAASHLQSEANSQIAAVERAVQLDLKSLLDLRERLSDIIGGMDNPTYQSLLTLRYLCGMPWEDVAEAMYYAYAHVVNRLHPRALEQFKHEMSLRA